MREFFRWAFGGFFSSLGRKFLIFSIPVVFLVVGGVVGVFFFQQYKAFVTVKSIVKDNLIRDTETIENSLSDLADQTSDNLLAALQEKGNALARMMVIIGADPLLGYDDETLDAYVSAVVKDKDVVYAEYFNGEGELLTHSAPEPESVGGLLNISLPVVVEGTKLGEVKLGLSKDTVKYEIADFRDMISAMIEMKKEMMKDTLGAVEGSVNDSLKRQLVSAAYISMFGVLLLVMVISLVFTRATLVPLRRITDMFKNIAHGEGDLTRRIEFESNDEMGLLANIFNQFMDTLNRMVSRIIVTAQQVLSTAESLSASSEEINASIQGISRDTQEMNTKVNIQARKINEAYQTIEKTSSSVNQAMNSANEGAQIANQATVFAKEGIEGVRYAVEKVGRFTDMTTNLTGVVGTLGERSKEIGRIVEVITNIADQTNLLSLNAAIEAARVGDAGRGFAVVAQEIRKLAENSAQAAEQISGLIRNIQGDTIKVVDSVRDTSNEVEEGKTSIEKVKRSLEGIVKAVEETTIRVEQIFSSAQVQLESIRGAEQVVKEVVAVAGETATTTQSTASSIEQVTASMEEMSASAQQLTQAATELKNLVAKFKVQ